jgi:2-keto-4-pentenoate hydratase/2-oxohepta-3-ene-1,7-dioic acid hydratase in catechol pathway
VEFLALEDDGTAALARLGAYVDRFLSRSDGMLLPRAGFALADVELLAPVPRPRLYWGLVTNAPSFVRNNPRARIVNLFPLGHQRPQGAAIGPGAPVTFRHGNNVPLMAYNVELAVVIGRAGRYIPVDRAMDHVAGYTVVNDVSGTYYYGIVPGNAGRGYSLPERYGDWLYQVTASWGGKKADTLAPMGPFLVTKDEIGDPLRPADVHPAVRPHARSGAQRRRAAGDRTGHRLVLVVRDAPPRRRDPLRDHGRGRAAGVPGRSRALAGGGDRGRRQAREPGRRRRRPGAARRPSVLRGA